MRNSGVVQEENGHGIGCRAVQMDLPGPWQCRLPPEGRRSSDHRWRLGGPVRDLPGLNGVEFPSGRPSEHHLEVCRRPFRQSQILPIGELCCVSRYLMVEIWLATGIAV